MAPLPAGYVPVNVIVDSADLGTTATASVGLLSAGYRKNTDASTCGAEFMSGQALGTAGIQRMDVAGGGRIAPTTTDRSVGNKLTEIDHMTHGAAGRTTRRARPSIAGATS